MGPAVWSSRRQVPYLHRNVEGRAADTILLQAGGLDVKMFSAPGLAFTETEGQLWRETGTLDGPEVTLPEGAPQTSVTGTTRLGVAPLVPAVHCLHSSGVDFSSLKAL